MSRAAKKCAGDSKPIPRRGARHFKVLAVSKFDDQFSEESRSLSSPNKPTIVHQENLKFGNQAKNIPLGSNEFPNQIWMQIRQKFKSYEMAYIQTNKQTSTNY